MSAAHLDSEKAQSHFRSQSSYSNKTPKPDDKMSKI